LRGAAAEVDDPSGGRRARPGVEVAEQEVDSCPREDTLELALGDGDVLLVKLEG